MDNKFDLIFKNLESEYSENNLKPFSAFTKSSTDKVNWFCKKCKEDYPKQINKRVYENAGCQICSRKKRQIIPLSQEYPDLLLDYDSKKNTRDLDFYTRCSGDKVWWKCHICGDEKYRTIKSRAYNRRGCIYCRAKKTQEDRIIKKISEEGSLLKNNPEIAKEWDFSKNKLRPENYLSTSDTEVNWLCKYGHSYTAIIRDRVRKKAGCKKCGSQNSQYEIRLFTELKLFYKGIIWSYRFQGKECDLFIPSLSLSIEVDGFPFHEGKDKEERDLKKELFLISRGIDTFRFRSNKLSRKIKNSVVFEDKNLFPGFILLLEHLKQLEKNPETINKIDIYINNQEKFVNEKEFQKFYRHIGTKFIKPGRSLAEVYPSIAKEFSSQNLPLTAWDVYARGKKVVLWDCLICREAYPLMVKSKTRQGGKGQGCPTCNSTSIVNSRNNLIAIYGDAIKIHWDYENNSNLPEEFRKCSQEVVFWKCPKGHSFPKSIAKIWCRKKSSKKFSKRFKCTKCGFLISKF